MRRTHECPSLGITKAGSSSILITMNGVGREENESPLTSPALLTEEPDQSFVDSPTKEAFALENVLQVFF